MDTEDEVYLEWLAAAPKGVKWDRAHEMYAEDQARRKAEATAVAKRLLGETFTVDFPDAGSFPVEEISESFWDGSTRTLPRGDDGH